MRTALAGFYVEGNGGSWNPGAVGDDWIGGGGGCGGDCGCGGSCGGDCGCEGGGGSCGGKPSGGGGSLNGGSGQLPLIPDYDGEIWDAGMSSSAFGGYLALVDGEDDPRPGGDTAVRCPCAKEEQECKECVWKGNVHPTPIKRNTARNNCLFRGPCRDYYDCVARYEDRLTDAEKKQYRERCPRFYWRSERLNPTQCCIKIRCRHLNVDLDNPFYHFVWSTLLWPIKTMAQHAVAHCAVVKVGCDGGIEMWESTPEPAPHGSSQLTGAITKHTGHGWWTKPYRAPGDPWELAHVCYDCGPFVDDTADPCGELNDDFVKEYPGAGDCEVGGAVCNSFAAYVEDKLIRGSSAGGRGVIFGGGCSGPPYWGSGEFR